MAGSMRLIDLFKRKVGWTQEDEEMAKFVGDFTVASYEGSLLGLKASLGILGINEDRERK